MHKAKKVLTVILVTHNQAAEVLQPRKQPLNLPSSAIAPQWATILRDRFLPIPLVRRDHLNSCFGQRGVERVGVISLIANQSLRLLMSEALGER